MSYQLGPAPVEGEGRRVGLQRGSVAGEGPWRTLFARAELVAESEARRHAREVVPNTRPDLQVVLLKHPGRGEHARHLLLYRVPDVVGRVPVAERPGPQLRL